MDEKRIEFKFDAKLGEKQNTLNFDVIQLIYF